MFDQFHVPDKDPDYVYRWCNTDDRAMLQRRAQGYEPVLDATPEIDPRIKGPEVPGAPATAATRRRGHDLILCRIPRKRFEETLGARRRALEAQHRDSIDDAIEQVAADASDALRVRSGKSARGLAFKTTPDSDFK